MYLHVGQSVAVHHRDIVGIFDMDNSTSSHLTRAFLERAERQGELESVTVDLPKSFVLCADGKKGRRVYLSQFTPATLRGRAENNTFE